MTEEIYQPYPSAYNRICRATGKSGFTMSSDVLTCSLLRTFAGTKPGGEFLELGTGTGLSTAWILDGMDDRSSLISVDHNSELLDIARRFLGQGARLNLVHQDGEEWIRQNAGIKFDFIFADTWHGKYLLLDEVLSMLKPGGLYIIDDMMPQSNWPEGHAEKAGKLVAKLEKRTDLLLTKQRWSTGIVIAVKREPLSSVV